MTKEHLYNFIVIEGNIGAGKTTLATRMAAESNSRLILEQFADNPFLPKFYENREKYAFPLEMSFLAERYQQLKNELVRNDMFQPGIISDYYFLKSLIFAKANLNGAEYDLYTRLFHIINDSLPKPDLFVYLYHHTERLLENIKKRGRPYEQNISAEYLTEIQTAYFDFLKQLGDQRILIINVNTLDFAHNEEHYTQVFQIINKPYNAGITRLTL
ncbi:MAG TPA: deoxynucleoside kinase [Bacteroidia bacterium]|jgi:deoxyadenosine/deoxycytidine kinase